MVSFIGSSARLKGRAYVRWQSRRVSGILGPEVCNTRAWEFGSPRTDSLEWSSKEQLRSLSEVDTPLKAKRTCWSPQEWRDVQIILSPDSGSGDQLPSAVSGVCWRALRCGSKRHFFQPPTSVHTTIHLTLRKSLNSHLNDDNVRIALPESHSPRKGFMHLLLLAKSHSTNSLSNLKRKLMPPHTVRRNCGPWEFYTHGCGCYECTARAAG